MVLAYAPQTDLGTGVLVPLVKAIMRPLYVMGAANNGWPMTLEMAQAEIADAQMRILQMRLQDRRALLTEETYTALNEWTQQVAPLSRAINDLISEHGLDATIDNESIAPVLNPAVVTYAQQTWAMLARLDNELLSLEGEDNDPGRLP